LVFTQVHIKAAVERTSQRIIHYTGFIELAGSVVLKPGYITYPELGLSALGHINQVYPGFGDGRRSARLWKRDLFIRHPVEESKLWLNLALGNISNHHNLGAFGGHVVVIIILYVL